MTATYTPLPPAPVSGSSTFEKDAGTFLAALPKFQAEIKEIADKVAEQATSVDVSGNATLAATASSQSSRSATAAAKSAAEAKSDAGKTAIDAALTKKKAEEATVAALQAAEMSTAASDSATRAEASAALADSAGNASAAFNHRKIAEIARDNALGYRDQAAEQVVLAAERATLVRTQGAEQVALAAEQAALATTRGAEQVALAAAQAQKSADSATASGARAVESAASAIAAAAARTGAEAARDTAVAVVTGGTASLKAAPGRTPIADATGRLDPSWHAALLPNANLNDIGVPGAAGFGVGICPSLPAGFIPLPGSTDPLSANYGNYQYSDGSVMCWIPAYYLRIGHPSNPTYAAYGVNSISVRRLAAYPTEAEANADGYYLHRAFVNAGANQQGFFRDKYDCSLNGAIASSIKGAMPMVSGPASMVATATVAGTQYTVLTIGTTDYTLIGGTNVVGARFTATGAGTGTGTVSQQTGFSGATANGQTPANAYHGAINAARSRGAKFVPETVFMADALSRLTEAHAQASTSTTYCAWYDSTGAKNFPKGNNNALKDTDDTSVIFTSAGVAAYPNFALAGSGTPVAKTTHNGQACGVADVNGGIWKINTGLTCIAASKTITGATQTNPVQLMISGHSYTTGRVAMIAGVAGMTQLNDRIYKLTVIDANTVSLDGVDGTAFSPYTSGGSCTTGTFYALKPSVDVAALTSGNALATDHWGAAGVAAQFDPIELNFATTYPGNGLAPSFGNGASAVFDWSTSVGRVLAMAGMPAVGGVSGAGTNAMGLDLYYQYIRNELSVISRGAWDSSSYAGSRARRLTDYRTYAVGTTGFSASRYL